MTTDEIRQAHFDSLHLKWANEDMIKYGSPSNARMTLKHHPEHLTGKFHDTFEYRGGVTVLRARP